MSDLAMRIYHRLPAPARTVVAGMRGFQLRHWRYGPETERLVAEALDRETWSRERIAAYCQERLARLLERAATRVPFYREQWKERRRRGDRASWDQLENWPLLEKESLRKNAAAFVADDCNIRLMFHDHTSGTTGKSLDLWFSKRSVRAWYALFEARVRRWSGVSLSDRWAMLGGQLVVPIERSSPPFWVWNAGLKQLYLSSYHLAPELISPCLDALARYRVRYLLGYSSSLYEIAQQVLRLKRADLRMRVVISNAEPLFDYQRQVIEQAFRCPVRETYGMAETVTAASECEAGGLHLWPEAGLVEESGAAGHPDLRDGELICTGLLNMDMPLIRYRVGDRGTLASRDTACLCKRKLPVISAIDGRLDDVLYLTNGRRVGRLDTVFKTELPIREAQIVQEKLDRVRVRYVPSEDWTPASAKLLLERVQQRLGDVHVLLEPVSSVPRGVNGKFRAVVCNLSAQEKAEVGIGLRRASNE